MYESIKYKPVDVKNIILILSMPSEFNEAVFYNYLS